MTAREDIEQQMADWLERLPDDGLTDLQFDSQCGEKP